MESLEEDDDDVLFTSVGPLVGALSVELKVVLTTTEEPGKSRLPMCDVEIIVLLLPQQFVVSEAALQQNLPGSHCKTFHEYAFPT